MLLDMAEVTTASNKLTKGMQDLTTACNAPGCALPGQVCDSLFMILNFILLPLLNFMSE